jgi:hypothetical protein
MSAISRIRESDKSLQAAMLKFKTLRDLLSGKPFVEASREHTVSKLGMFLQEALDSLPRCACGAVTDLACSDCRIERGRAVYVCERVECRNTHEAMACCSPDHVIADKCQCNPRLSGHTVDGDGRHYKARRYQTR